MKEKLIKNRLFLRKVADSYVLHRIKDNILTIEGDSQYTIGGIDPFYKLSKENCDEIFGVVDVEKLADDYFKSTNENAVLWRRIDFKEGFNKAMELNKDKLFTLEDIEEAFAYGQLNQVHNQKYFSGSKTYIQSLQQPTEIEVTFNPDEKDSDGCLILKKI